MGGHKREFEDEQERGDTGEVCHSREASPPSCSSSLSGLSERKSRASAMGEVGPLRRTSMPSRPNCEFVIIMVIMSVVGNKQTA